MLELIILKIKKMILQLNPQINIHTPLGEAHAFFIIDYGPWVNSVWVARLCGSGEVKHFDTNDIRIEGNPTLDEKLLK
jgi:hypothetical protein